MSSLFLILTSIIFPVLAIAWLCCIAFCIYKALVKHLERPGRNTKVQIVVSDRRQSPARGSRNLEIDEDRSGSTNLSLEDSTDSTSTRNSLMRLFRWNSGRRVGSSMRSSSEANEGSNQVSRNPHNRQNTQHRYQVESTIPDIEVNSTSGNSTSNFLNSSGGSLLLSDAIREARRNRTTLKSMKDKEINTEPLYYPKLPQSVVDPEDRNPILAPLQAPWPLLLPPINPDQQRLRKQSSASLPPTNSVRHFVDSTTQNR